MAKYQITIALITRLCREVEANSAEEAEQFVEHMYQEYKKLNNTDLISTEQHRKVELVSKGESPRFEPVGQ